MTRSPVELDPYLDRLDAILDVVGDWLHRARKFWRYRIRLAGRARVAAWGALPGQLQLGSLEDRRRQDYLARRAKIRGDLEAFGLAISRAIAPALRNAAASMAQFVDAWRAGLERIANDSNQPAVDRAIARAQLHGLERKARR